MQTGVGVGIGAPAGERRPSAGSIANTASVLESWPPESSQRPVGFDGEVARSRAAARRVTGRRERPGGRVDREAREAVVPAVRPVEHAARRVHRDLGRRALPREAGRQRRYRGRRRGQHAVRGVPRKGRDRVVQLVDDPRVAPVLREREVPRAGAALDIRRRRRVRDERPLRGVEAVHEHLVEAEIDGEQEAARRIDDRLVRVRAGLAVRHHARAGVLHDGRRGAEPPVAADRQQRERAAVIAGDDEGVPRRIDREMAGARAVRRLRVQEGEPAGRAVDLERAHRAVLHLVGGIEVAAIGVQADPGGAVGLRREPGARQRPGRLVEAEGVDAFCRALCR